MPERQAGAPLADGAAEMGGKLARLCPHVVALQNPVPARRAHGSQRPARSGV